MRCRKVQKLLSLYGDGKLPRRTAEGIETHLAACTECRCEAAELDEALSALRGVPRLRPAPAFKRAVIAAVRREAVQTRQGAWEWVLVRQPALATVAVTACVLLGGVAIWMHGRQAPLITPVREMIAQSPAEPAEMPVAAEESRPTPVPGPKVVRPHARARPVRVAMGRRHVRRARPAPPPPAATVENEVEPEVVGEERTEESPLELDVSSGALVRAVVWGALSADVASEADEGDESGGVSGFASWTANSILGGDILSTESAPGPIMAEGSASEAPEGTEVTHL